MGEIDLMANNVFFGGAQNLQLLGAFSLKLDNYFKEDSDGGADETCRFVKFAVDHIIMHHKIYDSYCLFNLASVGKDFMGEVGRFKFGERAGLEYLFVMSYRFLMEYKIVSPDDTSSEFDIHMSNVDLVACNLSPSVMTQIRYTGSQMVAGVVRSYLRHSQMTGLKELPSFLAKAKNEQDRFESAYHKRKIEVEALKSTLDSYKDAFNFVGLSKGFDDLKKRKEKEKNSAVCLMWVLAISMLLPLVLKVWFLFFGSGVSAVGLDSYLLLAGFELLLMYFFRVTMHNFKSVQTQLLQIDFRMTLCQFIQSYVDYAKDIKDKDSDLLLKFEQVVFSGIVNSGDAIPSSFDGLEQLSSLIASLRKS